MKACPTGALHSGRYAEMKAPVEQRLAALKGAGYGQTIAYGLAEMGGTHVLYALLKHPAPTGSP